MWAPSGSGCHSHQEEVFVLVEKHSRSPAVSSSAAHGGVRRTEFTRGYRVSMLLFFLPLSVRLNKERLSLASLPLSVSKSERDLDCFLPTDLKWSHL